MKKLCSRKTVREKLYTEKSFVKKISLGKFVRENRIREKSVVKNKLGNVGRECS